MDFIIIGLGFLLAYMIGLTGVGGGALVAPALFVVLDLPFTEAIGTSLIYALLTKSMSTVQHIRQATVHWRLSLLFGLWGIPGAVAGSYLLHSIGRGLGALFPFLMAGLLLVVAGLLAGETLGLPHLRREVPLVPEKIAGPALVGIGAYNLVVGVLMGVSSVGSGSLVIVLMVYLFNLPARIIVGTNLVVALMMVFPAAATHLGLGGVSLRVLGFLLIGSLAGSLLGSRATIWIPDRILRFAIVLFVALSGIATLFKAW